MLAVVAVAIAIVAINSVAVVVVVAAMVVITVLIVVCCWRGPVVVFASAVDANIAHHGWLLLS